MISTVPKPKIKYLATKVRIVTKVLLKKKNIIYILPKFFSEVSHKIMMPLQQESPTSRIWVWKKCTICLSLQPFYYYLSLYNATIAEFHAEILIFFVTYLIWNNDHFAILIYLGQIFEFLHFPYFVFKTIFYTIYLSVNRNYSGCSYRKKNTFPLNMA